MLCTHSWWGTVPNLIVGGSMSSMSSYLAFCRQAHNHMYYQQTIINIIDIISIEYTLCTVTESTYYPTLRLFALQYGRPPTLALSPGYS